MPTMPSAKKQSPGDASTIKQIKRLEQIYNDYSAQFNALKKEKNKLIAEIMKKIDDEKVKRILNNIK